MLYGLDNFVAVFGCSILTDSMQNMSSFSTDFSSWVIIFNCSIDFNELKAVLECLTGTECRYCLMFCEFVSPCFLKTI